MVGRHVWMRAADNFVVAIPFLVKWAKDTQRTHELARQEHVIYDTLEVKPTTDINNMSTSMARPDYHK